MTLSEQGSAHASAGPETTAAKRLAYEALIARLRDRVPTLVPPDARILVVSRGDDALLQLGTANATHFPQADDGRYAGFYPIDSAAAVRHLETLQERGARFILFPQTALWWLDHYGDLRDHLRGHHRQLHRDADFALFELIDAQESPATIELAATHQDPNWRQIGDLLDALLPRDLGIIVASSRPAPASVGSHQIHRIGVSLDDGRPVDEMGQPIIFALRDALRAEARYVVVPRLPGDETARLVSMVLRARYRVVVHHEALCTVFDPLRRR